MPELAERPRPWIAKFHPADQCCDAAKRMADQVTLHAIAGTAGQWCAIRLDDGSTDGIPYPDRAAAYCHNLLRPSFTILIPPGGMRAVEAEEVLHYHRQLHEQLGSRAAELPTVMPLARRDRAAQIRLLAKGPR